MYIYIYILLLSFFANPVRIQALSQPRLQDLLEACLFEPGSWQVSIYMIYSCDTHMCMCVCVYICIHI